MRWARDSATRPVGCASGFVLPQYRVVYAGHAAWGLRSALGLVCLARGLRSALGLVLFARVSFSTNLVCFLLRRLALLTPQARMYCSPSGVPLLLCMAPMKP